MRSSLHDRLRRHVYEMKLLRVGKTGYEKPAFLDRDGNARDLSKHIDDLAGPALGPESLADLAALDPDSLPKLAPDRIGPCVGNVGKFICIGLNFADHAACRRGRRNGARSWVLRSQ